MKEITGNTSLVALLGRPVSHSLSPVMHNAALQEMGLDWCYLAIPCETKDLEIIINALKKMDCKGANITIPHKKNVFKLCSDVSELATEIQAINTLIPNAQNGWTGTNTDIEGFLKPLKNKQLEDKNALILGCGGSARAVLTGLKRMKLKQITVISRNNKSINSFLKDTEILSNLNNKKESLIQGLVHNEIQTIEHIKNADIIINTTPVGMQQDNKDMPFGKDIWENLKKNIILYDLIYNPRPTEWLKSGLQKDCLIIDGLEMLVQQGAASLKLWSGYQDIPIEIMRKAAAEKI